MMNQRQAKTVENMMINAMGNEVSIRFENGELIVSFAPLYMNEVGAKKQDWKYKEFKIVESGWYVAK